MKKRLSLSIISVIVLTLWVSYSVGAIPVNVTVGKETVLTLKNTSQRISLANPAIADVKLISPTEIVINGKKTGITSLIVWDREGKKFYDVIVSDYTAIDNEHKKEDLLAQIKGIAPDADVKVHIVGDTIILTGNLKNEVTKKRIEVLASNYAHKVTNLISIEEAQQVILEVKVAQIDKSKMKDLGISALTKQATWELTAPGLFASPDGTVGGFSTGGQTTGLTGGSQGTTGKVTPGIGGFDVGALSPQIGAAYFPGGVAAVLRALAQKGYAKILAEPNLIVRSGDAGEFFVGTRVPVQEVTGVGASATPSITFENVGIRLNFKPEVLETGAIRLKIDPAEVANITGFITFSGIVAPEIDTRRVSTGVDLKDGESLVLAGLLSEETKKNIQKIPIFGDIPILGAIFRNTHDELTQKELAFFITPHLIRPISAGVKTELPEERRLSPQEEREFNWIPLPHSSSSEQEPGKRSGARTASLATENGNLTEEINLFMDQYRKAYEFGDIERFMSLYSKSATENGMNYNDIRRSYQNNFKSGRYSYTLRNPQVQRTGDLVQLTGSFSVKRTGEEGPTSQGNIRWTLAKENGVLKIVKVEY